MRQPKATLPHGFACERGQSLVEFALVAPLLIILMVGILDVGRAVNAYVTISNAAREGSHYAALHPTASPGAIVSAVRSRVVPLDPSSVTVTARYYDGSTFQAWPSSGVPALSTAGYVPVQVQVSYPWAAVTMLIGAFFSSGPLTAISTVDTVR